jgi:hypothetical protein
VGYRSAILVGYAARAVPYPGTGFMGRLWWVIGLVPVFVIAIALVALYSSDWL